MQDQVPREAAFVPFWSNYEDIPAPVLAMWVVSKNGRPLHGARCAQWALSILVQAIRLTGFSESLAGMVCDKDGEIHHPGLKDVWTILQVPLS